MRPVVLLPLLFLSIPQLGRQPQRRAETPPPTNLPYDGRFTFARLTYRGTHRGEALGVPPTGRRIEYAGAAVFHFRDDRKIASTWVLGDVWTLLRQLRGEVATNGTTA